MHHSPIHKEVRRRATIFFKKEYRYPIESILKLPYLVLSYSGP